MAFQGEPGAFSEEGVLAFFVDPEPVGLQTWREVFEAVRDGVADAGVVPIERSSAGSVRETYDLLYEFPLHIVGEVNVTVHLALVALPGQTIDRIERVYSIAQALDQAETFLRSRDWTVLTSYNTAGAAKTIADRHEMGAAAVASPRVADMYGLEVVARDIQGPRPNRTRFAVVAVSPLQPGWLAPAQPGTAGGSAAGAGSPALKTTLVWAVRNQPGSLYRCLGCFARREINLSRLESRPNRSARWEYVFWADLDADPADPSCAAALEDLRAEAAMVRIVGTYPRAESE